MSIKTRLLLSAAGAAVLAASAGAADAKPVKHKRTHAAARPAGDSRLAAEVSVLRAQVAALTARLDRQSAQPTTVVAEAAPPQASPETTAQIEDLQTQLADVQQSQAIQTATINANKPVVNVTLPNGRPTFASADGNFTANFHAVAQFDAGTYFQDKAKLPNPPFTQNQRDLNSGTNLRRGRLGIEGKAFGDFEYSFLTEFGGSGAEDAAHIHEIWGQYSGLKPFHLKIGYFEPLIGMNANISTNSIPFMERASPAEVSRNVAAGDTRAAAQLWANDDFKFGIGGPDAKTHWLASVAYTGNNANTVNSTGGFSTQPFDEQTAAIGRVAIAPYGEDWTVHLGVHGQQVFHPNDGTGSQVGATPAIALAGRYTITLQDRPELRLDTTRLVSTGALNANSIREIGFEGGAQWRNFFLQGEYFRYDITGNAASTTTGSPNFSGYYVEGTAFLTGESRGYVPANGAFSTVAPKHNFAPKDGYFGAFEIGARYSDLDLNHNAGVFGAATPLGGIRGGEQKITTVALDWYLNPLFRFVLEGENVEINRLSPAGLSLSQTFQTVGLRSQFAF